MTQTVFESISKLGLGGEQLCTSRSLLSFRLRLLLLLLLHLLLLHLLLVHLVHLVKLILLLLSLSRDEKTVGFLNLVGQVTMISDECVKVNNSSIEEHTCNLTSCFVEFSLDASEDGITDGLFLFVLVLNCSNCCNISLDRCKLRLWRENLLLHLLRLLLLLLLLLHWHWHSVGTILRSLVINTLLLVHVASTTSTTLSSLTLVASVIMLHVVVLIMLVEVTLWHQGFSKSHGERIGVHVRKFFLSKHLKHLAVLLLFL
mmetsp:Transcript_27417/g.19790  ORF Transcript_27417/g.19790 Transcript_27417/m.19790 type:complete len:259 (-) Transcript_27417:595-1371(-)